MASVQIIDIVIANGASESNPVFMESHWVAELRNEAAAALNGSLGIQTWAGEGEPGATATWTWLKDPADDSIYGVDTVSAESAYPLPPELSVVQWFRFKSHDGSGTAANQSAARALKLVKKILN